MVIQHAHVPMCPRPPGRGGGPTSTCNGLGYCQAPSHAKRAPGWHAWPAALAGLVYARRPRTSPPLVVRATSVNQLRTEIENAEQERGLR